MFQLPQRLRLDLPDAFASDAELLPDFPSVGSVFMQMPKRMRCAGFVPGANLLTMRDCPLHQ